MEIRKIAVIGAGTYGSYVIDAILRKYPDVEITLFDVGDARCRSEREIGYYSSIKRSLYKGLTHGRLFGFGGASVKWGGQLLTFTENDFANPDGFMKDVIRLDKKYKDEMLAKFKIRNEYPEKRVHSSLFTKTGVWLSALHHDFFKWFKIHKRPQVKILKNSRVVRLESKNGRNIDAVVYLQEGKERQESFDYVFLTAGAFESARILMSSGLVEDKVFFSDHLSQRVFKIKESTKIGDEDFVFRMRGTSLITKRLIGEVDGISYYVHPVFNLKFPFFESVKEVLFKKHFEWKYIWQIFTDIPNVCGFAWSVLAKRKMYVMNNEWYFYIDIENPTTESYVALSKERDKFGLPGLDVHYIVDDRATKIYKKAIETATQYLKDHATKFEVLTEKIDIETCEDIYHPYGMFKFDDVEDYYTRWENMLIVNTGCLTRSGGINPTASMLPLVDEFVNNIFN